MPSGVGNAIRALVSRLTGRSGPDAGTEADLAPVDAANAEAQAKWKLVQELFEHAKEMPATDRTAFVIQEARSDELLRNEVLSLLRADQEDGPLEAIRARLPLAEVTRSATDMAGQTVLHYDVLKKLDGGGMGVVYEARDTRLNRTVALKFLMPRLLGDDGAKERFLVEARTAAALDHPNVCTIHEVGETDGGLLYIAMAFYEGESLRRRIRRGTMSVAEAFTVATQVCHGLARAADHGIIHRDIKPANIMFAGDGTVKIVDFGLAKMRGGDLTRSGALMGTVSYMSPEQARGDDLDERTDVWSAGVVLYEMLAGVRPFQGGTDHVIIQAILNKAPEPLDSLVPGLPPGVAALVERTLEKDPAHRYPDAATLLSDVELLMANPADPAVVAVKPRLPPEGERRLVTVMAGAVSGLEKLLDLVEPATVGKELARLRARIEGVVEDYGGVVHEFSEHSVTALFGVPVAHEDDGLRAVRAARELVRAGSSDDAFQLRFAVASQYVAVSRDDGGLRHYRVGGTVVQDTGLIAASAGASEVLIAPSLRRAVTPFLETEERPTVTLSADRLPVAPMAVLGESEAASRLDGSLSRGLSPFVGRSEEMRSLSRALEAATQGTGGVVSIVGDAGVGKSRVLHEFRASLAEEGVRYLQGRCQSHGKLVPYLPFTECARAVLGLGRQNGSPAAAEMVERAKALDTDLEPYAPILVHLLSTESQEQLLGTFSAEERAAAAVEVLTSLFTLGSRGQALVLLLEDWHWADEGSKEVLDQLAEMVTAHEVLVVVTSRRLVEGGAAPPQGGMHIDLQPLDPTAATTLVRSALGGVRLREGLASHIESRTVGNPFFIEELCDHLVETESLVVRDGEAHLVEALDHPTIPETVQAVLKTRLDRLDPESREVFRSASVIGREFGAELLGRIVPSPSRLDGALRSLRSSGLIQRTAMIPEPRYRFKHALTLDVAYASLLERQRRERHALVGEAIEALHAERLDDFLDSLARHFAQAHDWDRAVMYGMRAAERAGRLWRSAEAVSALERVEQWMSYQGEGDGNHTVTLVDLLFAREAHLERLGRQAEQEEAIERLEALVPEEPSRARAALLARKVELLTMSNQHQEAEQALAEAMDIADSCGAVDEKARALRGRGVSLWRLKRYEEAADPLTRLLNYSRLQPSPDVLLRDLFMRGNVYRALGDVEGALAVVREVEEVEPDCQPLEQGMALNFRGTLYRTLGQPKKALELLLAASEKHRAVRMSELAPVRASMHELALAAVRMELGDIDEAMATYERAVDLARRGSPDHIARALGIKAGALLGIGRATEAVPLYREVVEVLRPLEHISDLDKALEGLARALEALGDPEAIDHWRETKEIRLRSQDLPRALEAVEREVQLTLVPESDRQALLKEALSLATRLDDAAAEARVRNSLAVMAWRAGDVPGACSEYEAAAARAQDPGQLGVVLNGWGAALSRSGRSKEAARVLWQALETNQSAKSAAREADSLAALGALFRSDGEDRRAAECYEKCVEKRQEAGDRIGEGWAVHRLAELARSAGASSRGSDLQQQALQIAEETGDKVLLTLCNHPTADGN